MSLQERDFFVEKQEMRNTRLTCTRCRRTNDYQLRWMRRTKKDRIPNGADERDRAMYAKLRDYLLRLDVPGAEVPGAGCGAKCRVLTCQVRGRATANGSGDTGNSGCCNGGGWRHRAISAIAIRRNVKSAWRCARGSRQRRIARHAASV